MKNLFGQLAKNLLLLMLAGTSAHHMFAIDPSTPYTLTKADGTVLGRYEVNSGPYFIRGQQGILSFYFEDPTYRVSLDTELSDLVCGGNKIAWTPPEEIVSETIRLTITGKVAGKDTTIVSGMLFTLPLRPNQPPRLKIGTNRVDIPHTIGTTTEIKLSDYIVDDDNDPLNYVWITRPANYPDVSSDGTIKLPATFSVPPSKKQDTGVLSITDKLTPINFEINVTYNPIIEEPKFTVPNPGGKIVVGELYEESALVAYAIEAYDAHNRSNKVTISIAGESYGLTYDDGKLQGVISYDAVADGTPDELIEKPVDREITLLATSPETNRQSQVKIIFKVKNKARPTQVKTYHLYKQDVDSATVEYRKLALEKWAIIWADVNKIKRRDQVVNAINLTLATQGGISAVFGATAPIAAISSGLTLVNGIIQSNLSRREEQVGTNIKILTEAVTAIKAPIAEYLDNYPAHPEPHQRLLTYGALNTMDKKTRTIRDGLHEFKKKLAPIVPVFR